MAGRGFRNLVPFDLATDARFVVLHGPNAQGKTNALEAVYALATLKPLRGHRVRDLLAWGDEEAALEGRVEAEGYERALRLALSARGRQIFLDGDRASVEAYFAELRAIAFQPSDGAIVWGEPAQRRRWIDRAAFTARPAHLDVVRVYRRALAQKAAELKGSSPDAALLDALDVQLARTGAQLASRREAMLLEILPHVRSLHRRISGAEVELTLRYRTDARGARDDEREASLFEQLRATRASELRRRMTLVGPQTDEVHMELERRAVRTYGSRGQVRSLVLALKLAELVAARERGQAPLFLLDDVSSELDRGRTERLVDLLLGLDVQVIATTTDPEHLAVLPPSDTLWLRVQEGLMTPREGASAGP